MAQAAQTTGFGTVDGLTVPCTFGRLMLLKMIARGGMGDVYLAATTGIEGAERPCVVKTIRRDHIHDGSFLARFLDEARVQSQLNHPGVAQVLEASTQENGEPYTVVEYVEGRSLADVRQRAIQLGARVGWAEAVAMGIEMSAALAHVHDRSASDGTPLGIVHRDLSPQNVMVGYAGEVKLIDFGTARGHNRRCHTVAGVVFAKPGYVAPEVARQQVGDARIDIYAVGIMIWELCAARRFLTGDPQKHLEDAANDALVLPPIAAEIGAPPLLDELLARLTANDPEDRYASAATAASDLARVLASSPPQADGARGVRARVAALMLTLWPREPGRSRAEFAKLLKDARALRKPEETPSSALSDKVAQHMNEEGGLLAGTPYRLVVKIGEGASGTVWKAEHIELGRQVAIKVLSPEHGSATDAIDRFRREARLVASLSHENLVQLFDFGKAVDGRVFIAMELLDGKTLDAVLTDRALSCVQAVGLATQAAHALEAAHAAGLVHRDLKPANLFLTKTGVVKLLDFGVAMALSDTAASETRQKGFAIFGTPEYMAPEQVAGESVDARCDVYALGCVLYELLTRKRPFEGRSSVVVLGKQLRELPEPPRIRAPEARIPRALEAVVLKALEKKPEDRYASAFAMRAALEAAMRAPIAPPPAVKKKRSSLAARGIAIAAAACTVALITRASLSRGPDAVAADSPVSIAPPAPVAATEVAAQATAPIAQPPATTSEPDLAPPQLAQEAADAKSPRLDHARTEAKARPSDARAQRAWAAAAFRSGQFREARRAADTWALHDTSPEPRLFLAQVLDASGHRADARAVLEEVLELYPDSADARRMHARLGVPLPALDTGKTRSEVAKR